VDGFVQPGIHLQQCAARKLVNFLQPIYGGTSRNQSIHSILGLGCTIADPIFNFLYITKKECGEQKQGTQADIAF